MKILRSPIPLKMTVNFKAQRQCLYIPSFLQNMFTEPIICVWYLLTPGSQWEAELEMATCPLGAHCLAEGDHVCDCELGKCCELN